MMNSGTDKVVVNEISNTQRISLKPNEKGVVIQKEHRKNTDSDWIISKGIEISRSNIPVLIEKLVAL